MVEQFANKADSTLNGGIDNVTTSIVVADGSRFPSTGTFRVLLGSDTITGELVLATARSGNTLTVTRGQEGTTAQSWINGTPVTHILTAGAIVTLQQTLYGKTLDSSLATLSSTQDGYTLTWLNTDGYWATRPGSPFTASGNQLNTTRTLSIDSNGTFTSAHFNPQLYVNGGVLTSTSYSVGEIPLNVVTYDYVSDGYQSFVVPAGVTQLQVKVWGPGGGTGNYNNSYGGASGGYSTGFLSVTPGETLVLAVGSGGKKSVSSSGNGGLGGWPGGGNGARGDASAGGGGGLSGVFTGSYSQANALMVAGGGGGSSGYSGGGQPGAGGGTTGNDGTDPSSGKGGTQIFGGFGGGPAVYTVTQTTWTAGDYVSGVTDTGNHTDDSPLTTVSLPFSFVFYGVSYSSVNVSSNGFVVLGSSDSTYNWDIPGTARPATIALWNRDNDTRPGGTGWFTTTVGSAPNRVFIIEYRGVQLSSSLTINAELKLYEGSTTFEVLYGTSTGTATDGTIGIQDNLGAHYTVFNNNTAPPASGTRLVYAADATITGKALAGGSAFTDVTTVTSNDAGGGGSGYFGGGAGQGDGRMGGGGSGYLHPIRVTNGTTTAGTNGAIGVVGAAPPGNTDTNYAAGIGVGGAATGTGSDGGNGRIVISYGNSSSLGTNSLTLGNNSSITGPAGFPDMYLNTSNNGSLILAPSSGLVTLQGTVALNSTTDLNLSFTNSLKAVSSASNKFRVFSTGAVNIGEAANNDTSAEAQAGLTGPLINIASGTGTLSTTANQATIFNQSGSLFLQGNTDVRFMTSSTMKGYFDLNGIFRAGANATSSVTMQGSSWPQTSVDYLYLNNAGSCWAEIVSGSTSARSALQVMNAGSSNTVGVSLFGPGTAHATVEYAGNGVIEQSGSSTSALVFAKRDGTTGGSFASTGAIWQSGAWTIGRATNNDTSSEAQAGLTGPLINLAAATGTFTSVTNQALNFNIGGAHHIQGHSEVRFDIGTALAGYFDSNKILRVGPDATSTASVDSSTFPISTNTIYSYSSATSSIITAISAATAGSGGFSTYNTSGGGTASTAMKILAPGATHAFTGWAGNGVLDQMGASTSALVFTKALGDGTSRGISGRIWQSGAWSVGDATQNDTSAEAQAGLTGPLLNLSQITGGSQTSTANQALLFNNAGTINLQGHVGHALIANTTTVASTSTSKFITNVGRRIATNVKTANYTITTSDEVIIVGTLASSITITLPAGPTAGDTYTIKDQAGGAAANNIIIAGNGNNIDGSSTYTMNTNYQSITVVFANGSWSII